MEQGILCAWHLSIGRQSALHSPVKAKTCQMLWRWTMGSYLDLRPVRAPLAEEQHGSRVAMSRLEQPCHWVCVSKVQDLYMLTFLRRLCHEGSLAFACHYSSKNAHAHLLAWQALIMPS